MMLRILTKGLVYCLPFFVMMIAIKANADRIILKDGTIEQSDRVWESDRYVHFILQGTQTVEIRYAKEIVARIEHDGIDQPIAIQPPHVADRPNPVGPLPTPLQQATKLKGAEPGPKQTLPMDAVIVDSSVIANNRDVKFYDPRRPQKYWAARSSRHDSASAAIDALARLYGKPAEWIESHMGEENDLGVIHERLTRASGQETQNSAEGIIKYPTVGNAPESVGSIGKASQIPFSDHPVTADRSNPDIVQKGAAGGAAHPEVNRASIIGESTLPIAMRHRKIFPEIPKGIQFYDPRRAEKYWSDETHRYNSLHGALKGLADFYGVSEAWVGEHLGKTNDLYQIHQAIREGLKSEEQTVSNQPQGTQHQSN
jgi:hypothetical protein